MAKTNLNEDKIALLTGCFIFLLAALNLAHLDVLGWVVSTNMWTSMDKAFSATTGAYKGTISGVVSLLCTYVALTAILSFGIKLLGGNVARFVKSFTVVFFISEICYMFGANAHIAATPDAQAKFGIDWSIGLTTEAGFIVALVAGIFISNAFPRIAESLHDACRPELFVKIAIVIMGAELGVKAADAIFVKAGLDWDDGRTEYEVEFYAGNTEYDYSIDATTGAIRSYDHDWDDFSLWNPGNNAANPSTPGTSTNNLISEAKAKEIALAKAPSGASVVRCHLDWDDGRYIYEIKMVSGTMEYECDINAATGVITDWDVDSIYD